MKFCITIVFSLFVGTAVLAQSSYTTPYAFVTLAGLEGSPGSANGTGSTARFGFPIGVAMDASGNVYVADYGTSTIRKITSIGAVSTLAGTAYQIGSTDASGSAARFNAPNNVAVDSGNNVYVSDSGNNTIRKITSGGVVSTVAGSAANSGSTDGTGNAARFNNPNGLAVDSSGNLYVADTGNNTIRKITAEGIVSTFAGMAGSSGSADGAGNAARFNNPNGLAVDSNGNLYVADSSNNAVRKITPAGIVTTLAGLAGRGDHIDGPGGMARFNYLQGIAVDSSGNVYLTDSINDTIRMLTPNGVVSTLAGFPGGRGSTNGTGSSVLFSNPTGVAVDSTGKIYVVDTNNFTIRKGILAPPGITSGYSIAGAVNLPLSYQITANNAPTSYSLTGSLPTGLSFSTTTGLLSGTPTQTGTFPLTLGAINGSGTGTAPLTLVVSPGGYTFTTLAGVASGSNDGLGTAARFYVPNTTAVDAIGNVYVADSYNNAVRKITPAGVVSTFAGFPGSMGSSDGLGTAARFGFPEGIAVDVNGNVYVADDFNDNIRKITPAGLVSTLAGSAGNSGSTDGSGVNARFNVPCSLTLDANGNVYVADTNNSTVRKITPAGVVSTLAGSAGNTGATDGSGSTARFNYPHGVTVDSSGNLFVADTANRAIRKITPGGAVSTVVGTAAGLYGPYGICVDSSENLYIADNSCSIRKFSSGGVLSTLAGTIGSLGSADGTGSAARFFQPGGLSVDAYGNLFVADDNAFTIRKITSAGVVTTLAGTAGAASRVDGTSAARFYSPGGVAMDAGGNAYVADSSNNVIRKITPAGVVTTFAGSGIRGSADGASNAASFYSPNGVAVDTDGNVYVADGSNETIRKITPAGLVSTLAGSAGNYGSADGSGSTARFYNPIALALDASGDIYVADSGNNTVRKITPDGVVSTFAGLAGSNGTTDGMGNAARFYSPEGVAVGPDGNIYVTDLVNHTIRKITPDGLVSTWAGSAGKSGNSDGMGSAARFLYPFGIAIDGSGNVYVMQNANGLLRMITPGGVVSTIAGVSGGILGSRDGTGGVVQFNFPLGIAADANGNVFVADCNNNTIRLGTPTLRTTQNINFTPVLNPNLNGGPITLSATSDSGAPLTYSVLFGPATILGNILTPTGLGTVIIQVSQAGTTGYSAASQQQSFTVVAANLTFSQWEAKYPALTDLLPNDTPQEDGVPTLLKYLYDIDPSQPMPATDRTALPVVGIDNMTTPGTPYLSLTYRQYAWVTGITVNVQTSTDLQSWTTLTPDISRQVGTDANTRDPIMEVGVKTNGVPKLFLRLNVTMP